MFYNQQLNIEDINSEYKEFSLNNSGIYVDINEAEYYCTSYKFDFNNYVLVNIKKYLKTYIPKYASSFWNARVNGNLYIGVNDFGIIKGIPYQGELDINYYKNKINKIINKYLMKNYSENIIVEFIKIRHPDKPKTNIHPEIIKYYEDKIIYFQKKKEFNERIINWRFRLYYMTQKLIDLVNNPDSRKLLINYIKNIKPDSNVIKLLESNYKLEYKTHQEIKILKDDINNPYYWVTRWKDEMIDIIKADKPIFNYEFTNYNTPINFILGTSQLIPYWFYNNINMNLYVIHIKFLLPKNNKIIKYYDIILKKWTQRQRLITDQPICIQID